MVSQEYAIGFHKHIALNSIHKRNEFKRLTWKTAWIKNVSSLNTMNASFQKFFEQTLSIKQHRFLFSLLSQPKVKKCSFNMRLPGH